MVTITESGLTFGDFPIDSCYLIEHSNGHKSLGEGFKMVEFTYLSAQKLFVVEAKSSIPHPKKESEYDLFWVEILEKFENALMLQMMACLNRQAQANAELPTQHRHINWQQTSVQLRLVIPTVPDQFLPQLTDKFRQILKRLKKLWNIKDFDIFVVNETKARLDGLVA